MINYKITAKKALEGFITGAVSAMSVMTVPVVMSDINLNDIRLWLTMLGISAFVGGLNGAIKATMNYFKHS